MAGGHLDSKGLAAALLRIFLHQGERSDRHAKSSCGNHFDAYRPWHVTKLFWDRFPQIREYLADPAKGSRHNRSCAVDLTLFDLKTGKEVAMPSVFDDFSERAHPDYKDGTVEQRAARNLLGSVMESEGFSVYENEWWHFDYQGWREYPILSLGFSDISGSGGRPY